MEKSKKNQEMSLAQNVRNVSKGSKIYREMFIHMVEGWTIVKMIHSEIQGHEAKEREHQQAMMY